MNSEEKHDARIVKTRQKVLDAGARVLFTDGWNEVTHLRLATETGVARGTIYRHWPSTDDLILEIFESCDPSPYQAEKVGDLRKDLIAELRLLEHNLQNSKLGDIIFSAAKGSHENAKIKRIHQNLHIILKVPFRDILQTHGIEAGQNDIIGQRLIAPILYAHLNSDEDYDIDIDQIADSFIKEYMVEF